MTLFSFQKAGVTSSLASIRGLEQQLGESFLQIEAVLETKTASIW
jgi:hypothetical protein